MFGIRVYVRHGINPYPEHTPFFQKKQYPFQQHKRGLPCEPVSELRFEVLALGSLSRFTAT